MSSSLRPVTTRFPSSTACLESSSLPLACVVTPLADYQNSSTAPALVGTPKCLHCGAPHHDAVTHFAPGKKSTLLCYLCARTSSTTRSEQAAARAGPEGDEATTELVQTAKTKSSPTSTFGLPLRLPGPRGQQDSKVTYQVPAISCPPLWMIVLDGARLASPKYFETVSAVLQETCKTMPPHVHVSVAVARQGVPDEECLLSLVKWNAEIPSIHQYWSEEVCTREEDLLEAVLDSLAPVGEQGAKLLAALAAMKDYLPAANGQEGVEDLSLCPVGWTLEVILAALQTWTVPAGHRPSEDEDAEETPRPYAGGKVSLFLATPSLPGASGDLVGRAGAGGFGGRLSSVAGERFVVPVETPEADEEAGALVGVSPSSDVTWTAQSLAKHYQTEQRVDDYYGDLGKQCAEAAMGIDIYCLNEDLPDHGLALLQILSAKSGAPGPLLFDVNEANSVKLLQAEVAARSPWHPNLVFGAELRVRLSPGFEVDKLSVEYQPRLARKGPQLAPLYSEGGLAGPATPVEESTCLWRMGTCDPQTTVTLDLNLTKKKVKDRFRVEDLGEVALKPVIQTCFAYTAIVATPDAGLQTVRQIRIASIPVPLTDDVEILYSSLDPQALAVVLFHKLAVIASQGESIDKMAQDWLRTLLVSVYRSAEEYAQDDDEKEEDAEAADPSFLPNERLLDREGDLSAEQVLLAAGHKKLKTVAATVFSLLQADPWRLGTSLDLRTAALYQLWSMTPSILGQAIRPVLQLWASGDAETQPIEEGLDLNMEAIEAAVQEHSQTSPNLMLLLTCPDQVAVMDARVLLKQQDASSSLWGLGKAALVVGAGLKKAIESTVTSCRTSPPVSYELEETFAERIKLRLRDVCVEDAGNFSEWRAAVAASVNDELLG